MDRIKLKQEILDEIKTNPILYGEVANALNIAPLSLPRLLKDNDSKLTQAQVLLAIQKVLIGNQDTMTFLEMQAI